MKKTSKSKINKLNANKIKLLPSIITKRVNRSLNTALFLVTEPSLSVTQVAQRIAQLQEALLHCGKFQDALEPLLSWLADTEELIANQKPPSAEYKVVKAQIQEQKVSGNAETANRNGHRDRRTFAYNLRSTSRVSVEP